MPRIHWVVATTDLEEQPLSFEAFESTRPIFVHTTEMDKEGLKAKGKKRKEKKIKRILILLRKIRFGPLFIMCL